METQTRYSPAGTRFIASVAGAALMVLACALPAATPVPPDLAILRALSERLKLEPVQEVPLAAVDVRAAVRDRLDASLLTSVTEVAGTDYRFFDPASQTRSQVAVLTLSYPDDQTARRMAKTASDVGGYLKRTKILTPFSCARVGHQLLITFTESAGNKDVVRFVNDVPKLLEAGRHVADCPPGCPDP